MNTNRVPVAEEDTDFAAGLYPALGPGVLISAARVRALIQVAAVAVAWVEKIDRAAARIARGGTR